MSEETQQAVVDETIGAAQPAPEGTNARDGDDLDTILKEFEERPAPSTTAQPEKPADTPTTNDVNAANETVLSEANFIREQRFKADMEATIKDVRGDLPADLYDDDFLQSWIDTQAKKDPRLATAWVNRNTDPKKFGQVKAALGREFAKRYGKIPDQVATEDRAAVTAAVRGASTPAPAGKAPDYASMSPSDFEKEWDKVGGK